MTDNDPFAPPTFQGPSFEPEPSLAGSGEPTVAPSAPSAPQPPTPFQPGATAAGPFGSTPTPAIAAPSGSSPSRGAKIGVGLVIAGLAAAAGVGWWQASANASDADELSAQVAGISAEVETLRADVATKDEALDAMATELAAVQADLTGAAGDRDSLATEMAALAADNATLAADLELATANLAVVEADLAAAEAQLADATVPTTPPTTAPPVSEVPASANDGVIDETELAIIQEALPGLIADGFTLTAEQAQAIADQTCAVPDLAGLDASAASIAEEFGLTLFEGGILSGLTAGFVCYSHLEAIGVPLG